MAWGVPKIGAVATVASGNITLAEPAGIAQGDLMVACIGYRSNAAFTVPGDWNLVATQQSSGDTDATNGIASGLMMWCVRGASAPTLTFNRTAGDVAQGRIIAYSGGHASAPYDTGSSNTRTSGNVSAFTGTITTAEAGELIVAMVSAGDNLTTSGFLAVTDPTTASGATDTTTAPTAGTWIERADTGTGTGADHGLAIADAVKATAGATGTISATVSAAAQHVMIAGAFKLAASGTPFTQNLGGSITPAGTIVKAPTQRKLGGLTPVGALIRLGTHFRTLSGAVTPAGALPKLISKPLAGAVTPTAALARQLGRTQTLVGQILFGRDMVVNEAGSPSVNGIYTLRGESNGKPYFNLTGAATSLTVSATVWDGTEWSILDSSGSQAYNSGDNVMWPSLATWGAKNGEPPAPNVTPLLVKVVTQNKTGAVTPGGSLVKAVLKSLLGVLLPAGSLQSTVGGGNQFTQNLGGTVTPAGTLAKAVAVLRTGTVTPGGALATVKAYLKSLAGSLATSGAVTKLTGKRATGAVTPTGAVVRAITQRKTGVVTPAGTLAKAVAVLRAGAVAPAGALRRTLTLLKQGTITSQGSVSTPGAPTLFVSGNIQPSGALTRTLTKFQVLTGAVGLAGTIGRSISKNLSGAVSLAGNLVRYVAKYLSGLLTPAGNLQTFTAVGGYEAGKLEVKVFYATEIYAEAVPKLEVTVRNAADEYTEML
jgi:hypothetical protein